MDQVLRMYVEENGFTYNEHENLIEGLTYHKSRLKKMKEKYDSMTIEKFEEDKKKLDQQIKKMEKKLEDYRKQFHDNLTTPKDQPLVQTKKTTKNKSRTK